MGEASIPAFRSHPRIWEKNLYVYPVLSRRARGLSIGVNLSPHKACNMDCVYCQVDRDVPATVKTVDLDRMETELAALLDEAVSGRIFAESPFDAAPEHLHVLADIALSGDGEPTSFRGFHDAIRRIVAAKQTAGVPDLPVRIITNAIDLDREEVVDALEYLDDHRGEIWAKLDAGTRACFDRVARTETSFDKVLGNIEEAATRRPIVIQALFMKLDGQLPPETEIGAWLGRLERIRRAGGTISLVQVYTVARDPAENFVDAVGQDILEGIAAAVRDRLGIPAEVY